MFGLNFLLLLVYFGLLVYRDSLKFFRQLKYLHLMRYYSHLMKSLNNFHIWHQLVVLMQ